MYQYINIYSCNGQVYLLCLIYFLNFTEGTYVMSRKNKTKKKPCINQKTKNTEPPRRFLLFLDVPKLKENNFEPVEALILEGLLRYRDVDTFVQVADKKYYFVLKKEVYCLLERCNFEEVSYSQIEEIISKFIETNYIDLATNYFVYNDTSCTKKFYRFTEKTCNLMYDQTEFELFK